MKILRQASLPLLLAVLASGCASEGTSSRDRAPLQEPFRVLILGDSISMAYTPVVRQLLGERAVVVRPTNDKGNPENCEGTNKGVENLDRWLALEGGGWDVIHFNFGLHDLKHVTEAGKNSDDPAYPRQAPPERYEEQLKRIVATLQETGARLVWATTTPVPEGGVRPFRAPGDVVLYNRLAAQVMDDAGVPTDDLYAFAFPRLAELQKPGDVHFTKAGTEALAEQVAAAILEAAGLAR